MLTDLALEGGRWRSFIDVSMTEGGVLEMLCSCLFFPVGSLRTTQVLLNNTYCILEYSASISSHESVWILSIFILFSAFSRWPSVLSLTGNKHVCPLKHKLESTPPGLISKRCWSNKLCHNLRRIIQVTWAYHLILTHSNSQSCVLPGPCYTNNIKQPLRDDKSRQTTNCFVSKCPNKTPFTVWLAVLMPCIFVNVVWGFSL